MCFLVIQHYTSQLKSTFANIKAMAPTVKVFVTIQSKYNGWNFTSIWTDFIDLILKVHLGRTAQLQLQLFAAITFVASEGGVQSTLVQIKYSILTS